MAISFEEGEHIILEVRKHWYVLVMRSTVAFILLFAPLVVYAAIKGLPVVLQGPGDIDSLLLFFYAGWVLAIWMYVFYVWTDYYLDIWIITNKKIMAVEQHGLFRRDISTLNLNMVQDITTEVHGMLATFMNFGDIQVETAGHNKVFTMERVAFPGETRQKINTVLNRYHDTTKVHDDDPYFELHDEKRKLKGSG